MSLRTFFSQGNPRRGFPCIGRFATYRASPLGELAFYIYCEGFCRLILPSVIIRVMMMFIQNGNAFEASSIRR
jgi:hypothetical protein